MTDTFPARTEPDADGFAPELWTYGGTAPGRKTARVALWYDGDRTKLAYSAKDTGGLAVGGVYEVQILRVGDDVTWRGKPAFRRMHADGTWRAQLEAAAYAAQRDMAAAALERRAKDWTHLDKALAPVVALAAGMNYAQRDALVAMVARKIYRAGEQDRDRARRAARDDGDDS